MDKRRRAAVWIGLALVAVLLPFFLTQIELYTASRIIILALFATSLNLLLGQTGLVSFAHAAYFGVGAYTAALLWLHLDLSPLWGIPLSIPVGAAVAFVTGAFALRAVRLYFALLTLALSQLLFAIAFQWYSFTRGDNGIHGIRGPAFLDSIANSYWFVTVIALLGMIALRFVVTSPFGAALVAIRENRQRASFIGLNVKRYELAAFTIAGAFAALAGSLFAVFNREAYPNLLVWTANATPIFVILIGGMFRFIGPTIGAVVFVILEETVTRQTLYSNIVLGVILLTIVLVAPDGIEGIAERILARFRGRERGDGEGSRPSLPDEHELEAQV
jgi:branched-chain amino acid transport system permease protein